METEDLETSIETSVDASESASPENPLIDKAKSHHPATASLPGGDKYTKGRVWAKRIFAGAIVIAFIYFAIQFITIFNVGGIIEAPDGPDVERVTTDFQNKATAPNYDGLKYISETTADTPTAVENVQVGRVVSATGEGASYACECTADVSFANASVSSTSKMRIRYTYNALLSSWNAGEVQIESSNYNPNGAPDLDKIQDDIMAIIAEYDEDSASALEGCDIWREGELGADGGEVTFYASKAGAGSAVNSSTTTYNSKHSQTNGYYDLIKTMKVRVKWNELEGWQARIVWMGTEGEADLAPTTSGGAATSTSTSTSSSSSNDSSSTN